jgi:hypothetical protein
VAFNEAIGDDGRPLRVIHRDIKPSNVLLSIHGEVKVVDFGIAKGEFEGREAETQSVVMGSRPYMAPERLDGISDSPSVDVYSAGMSLFELLTGRTMSLSINPVTHDQAMNRQLAYLQVPGMPAAALEDLRTCVRKMCSYDRDLRPSAADVSRDLEQCLFAIDPAQRIGLEEFAKTTVLPIYESRPKITPDDAAAQNSDDDFLREVTGQLTASSTTRSQRVMSWAPYVFLSGMLMIIVALAIAVVAKQVLNLGGTAEAASSLARAELGGPGPEVDPEEAGRVKIRVYLPQGAVHAQVNDRELVQSGSVRIFEGSTQMEVTFPDRVASCRFSASDGADIHFSGPDLTSISVNGGPAEPCQVNPTGGM